MAYRLKVGRSLAKSIRRAGRDQIERAASELDQNPNPHEGVHQGRKALKRMRALLQLIRPVIGEKAFAREDRRNRDLGRSFAGARDVQAVLDTVHKIEARYGLSAKAGASAAVREWLQHERSRVEEALGSSQKGPGLKALAKAERRFRRLRVKKADLKSVGQGLEAGYSAARRSFAKAYATCTDEDFHEWRKAMQRHWRHLQLVSCAWPEALQPRIDLAQELSHLLGDDHDLAVLHERVRANRAVLCEDVDHVEITAFLDLCRKRQEELRRLAKARGDRLFGETPKAFRVRIANYWRTASKISPLKDIAVDTDQGGHEDRKTRRTSDRKRSARKGGAPGGKVVPLRGQ
jgi:CHAD domain-containing protein